MQMFPANLYLVIFDNAVLLLSAITALVYIRGESARSTSSAYNGGMFWVLTIFVTIFIGTRPIDGAFVDMTTYATSYELAAHNFSSYQDWGFDWLMQTCAGVMPASWFFLICSILYTAPIAIAMRKVHKDWAFAGLLALAGSLSFFSYATNGIRNGISTSLLICAFAYHRQWIVMAALMIAAEGMHKSALLPIGAFLLTAIFARVFIYALVWAVTFVAVTFKGEAITGLFSSYISLGDDERLATYAASAGLGGDKGGYRLDFVLYSIVPVGICYWMANAKTRGEVFYRRLVCTYLAANTVWLLLMHAAYSNRFAYLSWFLMPWIIIYPFNSHTGFARRDDFLSESKPSYNLLSFVILANTGFTFLIDIFILPSRNG